MRQSSRRPLGPKHIGMWSKRVVRALLGAALLAVISAPGAPGDAAVAKKSRSPAPLIFGIYPGGAAGTVGPTGTTKPEDAALRLARLEQLRGGRPFVLHLYDSFTHRGDAAVLPEGLAAEIAGYLEHGFRVELVLTYRPADPAGDVAGFVEFVRARVRQLGPHPGVTGLQVTNEVNVAGAPAAADGAYPGARDALVKGVMAAKSEARRGGFDQLGVGFNWAYQLGAGETRFWKELGRTGGSAFAASVDWVGLDIYPGTWGPPLSSRRLGSGARKATLHALAVLRDQLLPLAGLQRARLHVSEAGFPTGPGRSARNQAAVLRAVAQAVSDARADHGVTDFRWFDLRDADSAAPSFESRYGLLDDAYRPKPAFHDYRRLIAKGL